MKKIAKSNALVDKLHKGGVLTCLAITVAGTAYLAFRGYYHLYVVKPGRLQEELKEKQALLLEGASDRLQDPAKPLSA